MTAFKNKPAVGTYTVNTNHAKCPHHLWMFDEGTGTPVDKGKRGGINLSTTVGSPTWGSNDLGSTGPGGETTSVTCYFDQIGDSFRSSAGAFSWLNDNGYYAVLMAVIMKSYATSASGLEYMVDIGTSTNTTDSIRLSNSSGTTSASTAFINSAGSAVSPSPYTGCWDQAWHMVFGRHFNDTSASPDSHKGGLNMDALGFTGHTSTVAYDGTVYGHNRIAVGDRAGSSSGNEFKGDIAAVMIWLDDADPTVTWNDAFVSSLVSDPWQFLDRGSPLILPHRSSGGMIDLSGNFRG